MFSFLPPLGLPLLLCFLRALHQLRAFCSCQISSSSAGSRGTSACVLDFQAAGIFSLFFPLLLVLLSGFFSRKRTSEGPKAERAERGVPWPEVSLFFLFYLCWRFFSSMEVYYYLVFGVLVAVLAGLEFSKSSKDRISTSPAFNAFKNNYLVVYSLMMGNVLAPPSFICSSSCVLSISPSHSRDDDVLAVDCVFFISDSLVWLLKLRILHSMTKKKEKNKHT